MIISLGYVRTYLHKSMRNSANKWVRERLFLSLSLIDSFIFILLDQSLRLLEYHWFQVRVSNFSHESGYCAVCMRYSTLHLDVLHLMERKWSADYLAKLRMANLLDKTPRHIFTHLHSKLASGKSSCDWGIRCFRSQSGSVRLRFEERSEEALSKWQRNLNESCSLSGQCLSEWVRVSCLDLWLIATEIDENDVQCGLIFFFLLFATPRYSVDRADADSRMATNYYTISHSRTSKTLDFKVTIWACLISHFLIRQLWQYVSLFYQ